MANYLYAEGGAGNIIGPSISTDNAVVRFDGITGKKIQNSGVIVDDSNNIYTPGALQVGGSAGSIGLSSLAIGQKTGVPTVQSFSNDDFVALFSDLEDFGFSPTAFAAMIEQNGQSTTGGLLSYVMTSGDASPLAWNGLIGATTPTQPAFSFQAEKWDGATSGQALSATEKAFEVSSGSTLFTLFGNGDVSASGIFNSNIFGTIVSPAFQIASTGSGQAGDGIYSPTNFVLALTSNHVDSARFEYNNSKSLWSFNNVLTIQDIAGNPFWTMAGGASPTSFFSGRLGINAITDTTIDGTPFNPQIQANSLTQSFIESKTFGDDTTGPVIGGSKARGEFGSPNKLNQNDELLTVQALGFNGTDYSIGGLIKFIVTDPAPAVGRMGSDFNLLLSPNGSTTPVNVLTIQNDGAANFAGDVSTLGKYYLKSAITQPFTSILPAAAYGMLSPLDPTHLGLSMTGVSVSRSHAAAQINGYLGDVGTPTVPAIVVNGGKTDGSTGVNPLGAGDIVFAIQNKGSDVAHFYGNGDAYIQNGLTVNGETTFSGATFGLQLNDISGSASLIQNESNVTNVDLTATGQTALFTVPIPSAIALTDIRLKVRTATAVTVPAQIRIGIVSGGYTDWMPLTTLPVGLNGVGQEVSLAELSSGAVRKVFSPGDVIKVDVATAATATFLTVDFNLYGYAPQP